MSSIPFNKDISLKYLGLPPDYVPSPQEDPISFLSKHISQLPPHLLLHYSDITTPKQRTVIPTIRNRRLQYANKSPEQLRFETAKETWPNLWNGQVDRRGIQEGKEEKAWAQSEFLTGTKQHIGKLGDLLAEYEQERKAERMRDLRRRNPPPEDDFVPEEDSDSDEGDVANPIPETEEELRASFERLIRERFIYGLLDNLDYNEIDWDETLDVDDRDIEERWFDDDDDNDEDPVP